MSARSIVYHVCNLLSCPKEPPHDTLKCPLSRPPSSKPWTNHKASPYVRDLLNLLLNEMTDFQKTRRKRRNSTLEDEDSEYTAEDERDTPVSDPFLFYGKMISLICSSAGRRTRNKNGKEKRVRMFLPPPPPPLQIRRTLRMTKRVTQTK